MKNPESVVFFGESRLDCKPDEMELLKRLLSPIGHRESAGAIVDQIGMPRNRARYLLRDKWPEKGIYEYGSSWTHGWVVGADRMSTTKGPAASHLVEFAARLEENHLADRIVITGGPRVGKTTLAGMLPVDEVLRTDDLVEDFEWSALSLEVSRRLDLPGPWVIEGVAAVRAVRKWMANYEDGKPCDVIVYLDRPLVGALLPGQIAMGKGTATILDGIRPELARRGVLVIEEAKD